MDILIGWQPYETKFGGAPVTMELRPLKVPAMVKLMPYINRIGDAKGDMLKLSMNTMEMQALAVAVFPDAVRAIDGVTVNGQAVTSEQMAEEVVFSALVGDIFAELIGRSQLSGAEEKNSGSPSTSAASKSEGTAGSPGSRPGCGSTCSPAPTSGAGTAAPGAPAKKQ